MISTKDILSKQIRKLEKRIIPKLRSRRSYRRIATIILIPIAITTHYLDKLIAFLYKKKPSVRKQEKKVNLKNIISGFANLAFPDAEVEKLAFDRAEVCAQCPFAEKTGMYSVIVDNRTTNIQGMKCTQCGCNLSAKIRSVHDRCPIGKW